MKLFVLIAVLSYLSFANNNIFIKNDGQINPEILYFSQIDNMNLFIKDDGIYFDFYNINEENSQLIKKGEVVKFNTGGTWTCETDSTGSATAWSAVTAPTGDLSLTFDSGETTAFTASTALNEAFFSMSLNNDGGSAGNDYLLVLENGLLP